MNIYYRCGAGKTEWDKNGCRAMIRADRWSQLFTLQEEADGRSGQRWLCNCGARYSPNFGQVVEMIDHEHEAPRAWYMGAPAPEYDIKDL